MYWEGRVTLKDRGREEKREGRETETERYLPFTGSYPQMPATAKAKSGQSLEPVTPSGSPTAVAGSKVLGPSPVAFPGILAESWMGTGIAGTQISTPGVQCCGSVG